MPCTCDPMNRRWNHMTNQCETCGLMTPTGFEGLPSEFRKLLGKRLGSGFVVPEPDPPSAYAELFFYKAFQGEEEKQFLTWNKVPDDRFVLLMRIYVALEPIGLEKQELICFLRGDFVICEGKNRPVFESSLERHELGQKVLAVLGSINRVVSIHTKSLVRCVPETDA